MTDKDNLLERVKELWFISFKSYDGSEPPTKECDDEIRELIDLIRAEDGWVSVGKELKTIKQAYAEIRHAQSSGSDWYTRGASGLFMQVRLWLDKADKAIKAIEGEINDTIG